MIEGRTGYMIVLSSPSGAGKTTLTKMLAENNERFIISVSCTTRKPRPNEINGKDYYFIDQKEFEQRIEKNYFYEHATIFNNKYGTLKKYVLENLSKKNNVLLDIDWQGTQQIKKQIDKKKLITIFILPPSIKILKSRLINRDQQDKKIAVERMKIFKEELSHWPEYDYVVINNDLQICYKKILEIIEIKEKGRKFDHKNDDVKKKVEELLSEV